MDKSDEKIRRTDDYPAVRSWYYITVEGYHMLNMDYGGCKSRINYRLNLIARLPG